MAYLLFTVILIGDLLFDVLTARRDTTAQLDREITRRLLDTGFKRHGGVRGGKPVELG